VGLDFIQSTVPLRSAIPSFEHFFGMGQLLSQLGIIPAMCCSDCRYDMEILKLDLNIRLFRYQLFHTALDPLDFAAPIRLCIASWLASSQGHMTQRSIVKRV
jgi:hypothetical protein